jgi:hypothetical protein
VVVAPQPERRDQHQLLDAVGAGGGDLGRHHPAERVADDGGLLDAEVIEQLVVVQDEVPEVLDVLDAL